MRPISITLYFVTIVLVGSFAKAQPLPRKQIRGKVISSVYNLSGIDIVNYHSRANTITITEGYFAIDCRPGDTLVFSGINFIGKQVSVSKEIYDGELMIVQLEAVANQIAEVIVDRYDNINAVSMGILQKQPRSFSKAERALKARGVSDFSLDNENSFNLGSVLSSISGRKGILVKDLAVERKLVTHDVLEKYFTDEFLETQMKIPENRVQGFKFYLIENAAFSKAIKSGDKIMATWIMSDLAGQYNKIGIDDLKLH